mmetsp:Transcript_9140/g.26669  ORF Transcript_9140/g.26669 Transcript_9140/m.26669 type:complete len:243 (+) Transcript_9140:1055-1783(+)
MGRNHRCGRGVAVRRSCTARRATCPTRQRRLCRNNSSWRSSRRSHRDYSVPNHPSSCNWLSIHPSTATSGSPWASTRRRRLLRGRSSTTSRRRPGAPARSRSRYRWWRSMRLCLSSRPSRRSNCPPRAQRRRDPQRSHRPRPYRCMACEHRYSRSRSTRRRFFPSSGPTYSRSSRRGRHSVHCRWRTKADRFAGCRRPCRPSCPPTPRRSPRSRLHNRPPRRDSDPGTPPRLGCSAPRRQCK